MKFSKLFMLAMAGLAMTACSNDDEMGENLSGNGVVEVRIDAPQTRALVDATAGDNNSTIKVEGDISVKLTAATGGKTLVIKASEASKGVKFFDVKGPTKVEAWVNGGDIKGLGETNIVDMQIMPKSIPAYGSTSELKLTGKMETNEGKKYEMYSATVTMEIPVARLEISNIRHEHAEGVTDCKYKTLTINGIYLDKVASKAGGDVVDYCWPASGSIEMPILKDEIAPEQVDFLKPGAVWPANGKAYAYNFYPVAGQMPIVKIYFENAEAAPGQDPVSAPRYAVIKSYNGDANFNFEAGKIYRITAVNLDDKNIIGDEEGNTLYGVDVTVTEAQWTVVNLTGEWQEQ